MTIRVVLADDQALLRSTFKLLLDATDGIEVVGEAATGEEALALAKATTPDVVVMDVRMPGIGGVEATRLIAADPACDGVRVLVLTTFETEEIVLAALRAGASGFLGKGVEPAGLIEGIRTVARGDELLSPAATRALIARVMDASARPVARAVPGVDELTARERELVTMVATGATNAEIAASLVISEATVKTHVNRAMMKVGARDRAQLVVVAFEAGLAAPGA